MNKKCGYTCAAVLANSKWEESCGGGRSRDWETTEDIHFIIRQIKLHDHTCRCPHMGAIRARATLPKHTRTTLQNAVDGFQGSDCDFNVFKQALENVLTIKKP